MSRWTRLLVGVLLVLWLGPFAHARENLSWVDSWGYWLQNPVIETMLTSPYDLFVIDYSRDGTDATAFTSGEIGQLKDAGRLVLAYLSIGEAEDYRFYWRDDWREGHPSFIGPENPDWPGNYKVKYWKKAWWKKALKPYLNRILKAGFEGVYLDLIDAYYYWGAEVGDRLRLRADQMVKLVKKIARYARKRNPNFVVCVQNGLAILDDASPRMRRKYLKVIDCVGVEDLFYNIYSEEDQEYRLEKLEEVSQAGKLILNVEYIPPEEYSSYFATLEGMPFKIVGYPADPDRELDELILY